MWRLLVDRVAVVALFGVLDTFLARDLTHEIALASSRVESALAMLMLVAHCVYFVFVTLMIILVWTRPPATERDRRFSSWFFSVLGTFGLSVTPLLPGGLVLFRTTAAMALVEAVVITSALTMALVTLAILGRCFSITPQARGLVVRGPYRIVRHPLYLCEAMSILAIGAASGTTSEMSVALAVLIIQVRRTQLEERVLSSAFPEYRHAFRGIRHLVPGIY
jgi:protein-S-isoprenylcysteine O-methyltransferase Ste14